MSQHASSIVLTPTRRLASQLMKNGHLAADQGKSAWETPPIQALGDWLQGWWDRAEIQGEVISLLLTSTQAVYQWENIIRQDLRGKRLLKSYDTAKMAYRAWELVHYWRCETQFRKDCSNVDHETFAQWADQYAAWLQAQNYIDPALLGTVLSEQLANKPDHASLLALPREINLVAFDSVTPQVQHLLSLCEQQGISVKFSESTLITPEICERRAFPDSVFEAHACAQWAKAQIAQGKKNIAIIVPNLPDKRSLLERIILETVDPALAVSAADPYCEWLNFSAAKPLIQYPLVQKALVILNGAILANKQEGLFSFEQWTVLFREILEKQGWPGERSLNSIEHQVVKRFDRVLDEFMQWSVVSSLVTFTEAHRCLSNALANVPFQPESKHPTVQALGTLEASGLIFDAAWILGLHRDAWPEFNHPNPFISAALQREHQFPHACPLHEMHYARQITTRLQHCANTVIFSYPLQEKDRVLSESPLIADLPLVMGEATVERCEALYDPMTVERICWEDNRGPSIQGTLRIGTGVLRLQAQCPFKAFAQTRLEAVMPEDERAWFAPFEKGIILHALLDAFWREIPNQAALTQHSPESLSHLITRLIDRILPRYASPRLSELIVSVEKQRLQALLLSYCDLEKTREPFAVVATEWSLDYHIPEGKIAVRLDRIDHLSDQESASNSVPQAIVIDYKTGKYPLNVLLDPELEEVQLPAYYLALCQAGKMPTEIRVIELGLPESQYQTLSAELNELKPQWEARIGALAEDYRSGVATVAPRQGALTCRHCELAAFCRQGMSHELS